MKVIHTKNELENSLTPAQNDNTFTPNLEAKAEGFTDEKKLELDFQKKLSLAITISLDIKNNFELMAYRVIDQKVFVERINDLLEIWKKN